MLPEILDDLGYILEDVTPAGLVIGIPLSHALQL